MSILTYYTDGTQTVGGYGTDVKKAQAEIDFTLTTITTADVIEAVKIPAGALVHNVYTVIVTAEGSTATATVGDADAAAGWGASVDLNGVAGTMTGGAVSDTFPALGGKYYASADTIDLTVTGVIETGKVKVIANYSIVE